MITTTALSSTKKTVFKERLNLLTQQQPVAGTHTRACHFSHSTTPGKAERKKKMVQDDEIVGSLLEQIHSINHPKQLSLITIRGSLESPKNDDVSVFPPANHENLQIPPHPTRKQQDPSAKLSSSLSLPPSNFSTGSSKEVKLVIGWLDFGLDILRAKIMCAYSWFCNNGEGRRVFYSFGPVAGVAVLVWWWWLCRRIKRGRRARESVQSLKLIIKEKDEKISKLLHQIAQMNEVLVARHKVLASKLAN